MAAAISGELGMEKFNKMPDAIHALMTDLAVIRQTILVNAPTCLPQIAPVLIDAEDQIRSLWT